MYRYDYLVVGCGIFGATCAEQLHRQGKKTLVIDKREHIGGNCYTGKTANVNVHRYGPHIFHTNNRKVWEYINRFVEFNHFINRPKVIAGNKVYSFPINLMTLHQLWGVRSPAEAKARLQRVAVSMEEPTNLEDWMVGQVGREIYETFVRGYTKKQWQRDPRELPASIIKRLPIRLNFNDNYFNDRYQGIPIGGYTGMFERMLKGIEIRLNTDYFANREYWRAIARRVIYTGKLDEYFDCEFGELEYRSLRFETQVLDVADYQGNAVINYADERVPYTRVIEHKHFEFQNEGRTVVTWEYPDSYGSGKIAYYPINNDRNNHLYNRYREKAKQQKDLIVAGRLGTYRYLDMDQAVAEALAIVDRLAG